MPRRVESGHGASALGRRAGGLAATIGFALGLVVFGPGWPEQALLRAQDGVGFRASVSPDTVYVGQQATYALTVVIPPDVRQRLRRNPVFVPPEARGMLAYEFPLERSDPVREGAEVHVFRRALFPLTAGRHPIAASHLTYALPQSPSFFSREEERLMRSQAVALVVIDPPVAARPANWLGAVGRWRVTARADATQARVGDPFVLTLRVEGTGNATLLPRPPIAIAWASVVTEDERVSLDTTVAVLGGSKEFSWLVTPQAPGTQVVPPLAYAFFDPVTRRYETARSAPITVRVRPGDLVSVPTRVTGDARGDAVLTLRPHLEGARPIALPAATAWMWIALLAPLPWVATVHRRRRRRVRARSLAERVHGPDAAVPSTLRALLEAALAERTGVRLDRATDPGALALALRREGVTAATATEAESLRDALETAAYARGSERADLRVRVASILARVGQEARQRRAIGVALLALLAGAAGLAAQRADDPLLAFTEGQTAYAGRDFVRARDAFLRAARAAPRDPAAWANLGTAAWQAADTAGAVLGWQRALRLDPLAEELRSRLERVRAPQSRGAARVWALPPRPIAVLALVWWCVGWGWLALAARREAVRWQLLLVAPGFALAALSFALESRLRATNLAVIATATPLRALPALGAEQSATPLVGEVVRVRERRGVWVRIELEAGRAGWYPAERTYPLARD